MNKLFNKVQSKVAAKLGDSGIHGPSTSAAAASAVDINAIAALPPQVLHYRYRKQFGVNLGSWFSLETWLTPSLFAGVDGAKSEIDLHASGKLSPQEISQRLQRHWSTFIDDGEWRWMKEHGINSVRIPIAYFHFLPAIAPHLMQGTEYEPYAEVYKPAAKHIQRAIETASRFGIGVLIDLHGTVGGQGTDGHTGLSTGKAALWEGSRSSFNQQRTKEILVELVKAVGKYDNLIGVELLNEPKNSGRLAGFYDETIAAIRSACAGDAKVASVPLYLSDSWDLNYYSEHFGGPARCSPTNVLVIDHHLYRCFTGDDHKKSANEHAQLCKREAGGQTYGWMQSMANKAHGNLIIGEWSGALHFTSFQKGGEAANWAHSQLAMYNELCAGNYFWTLKKEGSKDVGWCLYSAVEEGVLPANLAHLPGFGANAGKSQEELASFGSEEAKRAVQGHAGYWDQQKGGPYEHWRYEEGFQAAWNDCLGFWFAPNGEHELIGLKGNLGQLRLAQHRQAKGDSKFAWEFEHGFSAGANAFDQHIRS